MNDGPQLWGIIMGIRFAHSKITRFTRCRRPDRISSNASMGVVHELEKNQEASGTDLRCPDCGWTYFIEHKSTMTDFLEERYAERIFRLHDCQIRART